MRSVRPLLALIPVLLALACGGKGASSPTPSSTQPPAATRSYRMGFGNTPPKDDQADAEAAVEMAAKREDAAIFHFGLPYQDLLSGTTATQEVTSQYLPLAQYYRSQGLAIWVTFDVTDGLDRTQEDPTLTALGRSITDPAIQAVYRDFVQTFVAVIQPDEVGLAAETNLIRIAAAPAVYQAVVTMTNAAAAELQAQWPALPIYVTVQVDTAWGRLQGNDIYLGVEQDFADFPFIRSLGLSSYPYLAGFTDPAQIPLDYYQRLLNGRTLPLFVAEGGWTSAKVDAGAIQVQSSPAIQAAYITRQGQLLDTAQAVAVFQLTFADIDLSTYPSEPSGATLPLFTCNGLVDDDLNPKPALAAWDALFDRQLK